MKPSPFGKQFGCAAALVGAIAIGVIGTATTAYIVSQSASTTKQERLDELTVPIRTQSISLRVTASGKIVPRLSVNISPKQAGRVVNLLVEQGDEVEAGDVIAVMENRDIAARGNQAVANAAESEAQLLELQNGPRQEQIVQARARLAQAQVRLQEAQLGGDARIKEARANLTRAQFGVEQEKIRLRREQLRLRPPGHNLSAADREERRAAERDVREAQARVQQAKTAIESSNARVQLDNARERLQSIALQAEGGEEIAQAEARVIDARAQVELIVERLRANEILFVEGAVEADRINELKQQLRSAEANLEEAIEAQQALIFDIGADLERTDASLAEMEAQMVEATHRLNVTQIDAESELLQADAQVAEAQQALQELENGTRPEEILQAQANLEAAKARIQELQIEIEDTQIRAPFPGIITQRFAEIGAFVTPTTSASNTASATSTSIVALATKLREILAEVPEVDIGQIRQGQWVRVVADAYPNEVFKGRVRLVAPEAVEEENVTLFQVRVELDPAAQEFLLSGMNVDLTFLGDRIPNALVVPSVAVISRGGETGVLVPDAEGRPQFRPVTIGTAIDNQIQILEGVAPGDRVFVDLPPGEDLEKILQPEDSSEDFIEAPTDGSRQDPSEDRL